MGEYKYNIIKIVEYLRAFKENIKELYVWNFPNDSHLDEALSNGILSKKVYEVLYKEKDIFLRNVKMKKEISKMIMGEVDIDKHKDIYSWIVNKWGRIKVNNRSVLYNRVNGFLDNNRLDIFQGVSSTSKVLSFIDPQKYIIYDSRVVYALNWIMFKTEAGEKFFPIPEGRNTKLSAFDISTIIRLNKAEKYLNNYGKKNVINKTDENVFIKKREAYMELCELVNLINSSLWDGDEKKYPFYTEMILFSIADTEIFKDIMNTFKKEDKKT